MRCTQKFGSFLVGSLLLSPALVRAGHGQSMPAGQFSHRLSAQPAKDVSSAAAIRKTATSPDGGTSKPGSTTQPATNDGMQPISGKVDLSGSTLPESGSPATTRGDQDNLKGALGAAHYELWKAIVAIDSAPSAYIPGSQDTSLDPSNSTAAVFLRTLDAQLTDFMSQKQALATVDADIQALNPDNKENKALSVDVKAKIGALTQLRKTFKGYGCWYSVDPASASATTPTYNYTYNSFLPLSGPGCTPSGQKATPIQSYFNMTGWAAIATNVQYLYNAQLSTSQLTGQLLTATFNPPFKVPPFQAILSATATSGSSAGSSTAATTTDTIHRRATNATNMGSSDSTATAMAKLQAGGDFNLNLPMPLVNHISDKGGMAGYFSPNIGLNINGFSGQNTITESTEYAIQLPLELYAQTTSMETGVDGLPSATFFVDVRPAAEIISSTLAKTISPDASQAFFLAQASAGIEFAKSIRLSFQYIYSQKNIFTQSTDAPAGATQNANGFHLAVSFSPVKKSS